MGRRRVRKASCSGLFFVEISNHGQATRCLGAYLPTLPTAINFPVFRKHSKMRSLLPPSSVFAISGSIRSASSKTQRRTGRENAPEWGPFINMDSSTSLRPLRQDAILVSLTGGPDRCSAHFPSLPPVKATASSAMTHCCGRERSISHAGATQMGPAGASTFP